MLCNGCGADRWVAVPADLDVSAHPSLSGQMLACSGCGRAIRLLHNKPAPKSRPARKGERNRAVQNRIARAQRRHGLPGGLA